MSLYTYFSGILGGLFLLSGFFSLFLYVGGVERKINLPYFAFALLLCGAGLHGALIGFQTTVEAAVMHDRIVNALLLGASAAFVMMITGLTGYGSRRILTALLLPIPLFLVINFTQPGGLTFSRNTVLHSEDLVWGEHIVALEGPTAASNWLLIAYLFCLIAFVVLAARHQMRTGEPRYAKRLLLVILFGFLGMTLDIFMLEFRMGTISILDDVGYFAFVFLIGHRNFTNLIRSKELIRASEERFSRLTEAAFEGIAISEAGVIVDANTQFSDMFGYEPRSVIGKPIADFMATSSRELVRSHINAGENAVNEHTGLRRDGSAFPIELRTRQMQVDNRDVRVTVLRDITERKATERELIAQKERAEQSDTLKDAFIAAISHEIRTPLNVILGHTSLIRDTLAETATPRQLTYFRSVQRGAERLMHTVDSILNISRARAGDIVVRPVDIRITPFVEHVVADFRTLAADKSLALDCTSTLPDAVIRADKHCVAQCLANLLDNAIKYTRHGGVAVRISSDGDAVRIDIADTGIGIAQEYLPRIFNPYSQEDQGYSRAYEGIGLGLSLVKHYAELNSITIGIRSSKGHGTTVTLHLPITRHARADAPVIERLPSAAASAGSESATAPMPTARPCPAHVWPDQRVLIVEDDEMNVLYMTMLLDERCQLLTASTADEAWETLHNNRIDLILVDISLRGGKTGLMLTKEVRSSSAHAHIPIFAVTAHAFPHDRTAALDAGCNRYIIKPIDKQELFTAMDEVLR